TGRAHSGSDGAAADADERGRRARTRAPRRLAQGWPPDAEPTLTDRVAEEVRPGRSRGRQAQQLVRRPTAAAHWERRSRRATDSHTHVHSVGINATRVQPKFSRKRFNFI